jgi:branched-chain amino acid aminotransferase
MLDRSGFVAETNATHVFLVEREKVVTGHTRACPEGITRATVLGLCETNGIEHEVRDLSLTEVYRADEMFCTGTMGELAAVTTVDGRRIGSGEPGPMTRRLTELYRRETARAGYPVLERVTGG